MADAYYRTNSPSELIAELEHKADIKAWETFFPYEEIKKLMKRGLTTATRLSSGIIMWKPLIWLDVLIITIINIMVLINTFHPFLLALHHENHNYILLVLVHLLQYFLL